MRILMQDVYKRQVVDAETIDVVLPKFLDFIGDAVLVAHNAGFDVSFIEQNCRYQEIEREFISLDTVALARVLLPTLSKYKLNVVAKALNISLENHHRAVDDACLLYTSISRPDRQIRKKRRRYDISGSLELGKRNT